MQNIKYFTERHNKNASTLKPVKTSRLHIFPSSKSFPHFVGTLND